jgi:hypothetical protein
MTSARLFMKLFWLRVALVRVWVDIKGFIAPRYADRQFRQRFSQLPESVQQTLLRKHGRKSL